jgi:hypothetical protein
MKVLELNLKSEYVRVLVARCKIRMINIQNIFF